MSRIHGRLGVIQAIAQPTAVLVSYRAPGTAQVEYVVTATVVLQLLRPAATPVSYLGILVSGCHLWYR